MDIDKILKQKYTTGRHTSHLNYYIWKALKTYACATDQRMSHLVEKAVAEYVERMAYPDFYQHELTHALYSVGGPGQASIGFGEDTYQALCALQTRLARPVTTLVTRAVAHYLADLEVVPDMLKAGMEAINL